MRASRLWLIPLLAAAGCGRDEPVVPRPAIPALERPYRPPADGRLTEAQVRSYLASLRAAESRREGKPAAPPPSVSRADEDPGPAERGSHGEEFLWIRQKVLEAEMRLDERAAARREV